MWRVASAWQRQVAVPWTYNLAPQRQRSKLKKIFKAAARHGGAFVNPQGLAELFGLGEYAGQNTVSPSTQSQPLIDPDILLPDFDQLKFLPFPPGYFPRIVEFDRKHEVSFAASLLHPQLLTPVSLVFVATSSFCKRLFNPRMLISERRLPIPRIGRS